MKLLDCTLRDGANVVGTGFSRELTEMMLKGLIKSGIRTIEYGNAYGIGAGETQKNPAPPLSDVEYLDLVQPYLSQAEIGMFVGVKNAVPKNIDLASSKGINFLRIGANAGDGAFAKDAVPYIKKKGMVCRYSLMKGYILSAKELAREAAMLESLGLDEITIMDSAGTMMPVQVEEYVTELTAKIKIPVGFHGHNNLGLSAPNALAAFRGGSTVLDCGLMGMARSAGNLPTEMAAGIFQRNKKLKKVNFLGLLDFIDNKLAPAMAKHNYRAAVVPEDLILGIAGCHSNFLGLFKEIAKAEKVSLYQLIMDVSKKNRKNPSREEIVKAAREMK